MAIVVAGMSSVEAAAQRPFDAAPVGDAVLDSVRGTYLPGFASPRGAQFGAMQDAIGRDQFRWSAGIGGLIMDNWWSSTGVELAVNAGLAARP